VDFAQARVSNLGHMSSQIVQKCSVCGEDRGRDGYNSGSQWSEGSKKRKCTECCKKRLRDAADAPCTHAPTPSSPALGGQSAAAGITDAGAGADAAACDEGAPAKRPRDGDSAAAGHAGQRCALPSCDVLRYNEQVVAGAGGAEVDARRSFVALYAPSVVGTKWPELVLPGGVVCGPGRRLQLSCARGNPGAVGADGAVRRRLCLWCAGRCPRGKELA
jgi:hypothetical protein